jgi:hypothetical protein
MPCLVIKVSDETSRLNISIHKKEENINTLITKIGDPFIVDLIYNNLEISPIIHRIGESLNITTEKKNPILNIRCSILCSVATINDGYEVFEASDGRFILYDGDAFKVIEENGI